MGRRNVLFGVLAVVAIVAVIMLMVRRGSTGPQIGTSAACYGKCLACTFEGEVKYPGDEFAPHTCPQCDKAGVYSLYYCEACKLRFVPTLVRLEPGGPLRVPDRVQCPVCGSPNWALYLPKLMSEGPKGDAPWPEWP